MMRVVRGLKPAIAIAAAAVAMLAGAPAAQAAGTAPNPTPAKITINATVKSATWGSLHVGDCQQDGGTIVIRSDGTGTNAALRMSASHQAARVQRHAVRR
jgi:hypothetical protein